ncbi:MAG: ABC transporter substrate-binding protein [Halieaceae bacterium]|nr:ABC transporter substrate-binding protein [Halieaceae bacterium]
MDLGVRNAQFAGLNWAESQGWFADAGLELQVFRWSEAMESVAAEVVARPGTIGSVESGLFLASVAQGEPIVAIGTMFQASPLGLISLASSGITMPADLRGKTVAVHGDGHEAIATMLDHAGIPGDAVTVIEATYGNEPLLAGQMDAKQGYVVDEFVKLQTAGHDVRILPYKDYGHVAYSQVMFVSRETLETYRTELVEFLAVLDRGWRAATADTDAGASLTVEQFEPQLDLRYQQASLAGITDLLWAESDTTSAMQEATWQTNASTFLRTHPGASLPPMSAWADFSLVRDVAKKMEKMGSE